MQHCYGYSCCVHRGLNMTRGKIELFHPVLNPFEPEYIDTSCCFRAHFVHTDECIEISIKYSIDVTPWNRKGSRSSGIAPPKSVGSFGNGREGLSGRHSSSKVTERLERTIRVVGK